MKVYIVVRIIPYEGSIIEKVYKTKQSATAYATKWNQEHPKEYPTSEYMVVLEREVE
jgi:hypothetical protein